MRTPNLNSAISGVWTLFFLLVTSFSIAQAPANPFHRKAYKDLQAQNIDVMLAVDYQKVSEAIGNSEWWQGLSTKARVEIRQIMTSMARLVPC